jgi:hypothetical protein
MAWALTSHSPKTTFRSHVLVHVFVLVFVLVLVRVIVIEHVHVHVRAHVLDRSRPDRFLLYRPGA